MLQIDLCAPINGAERIRPIEPLTGRATGLSFSTALPGGFAQCQFQISLSNPSAFDWYSNKIGYMILIHEAGQTVWEGRIQSVNLQASMAAIVATGYWSMLTDRRSYQWWAASRIDWRVPTFFNTSPIGLPVIPWSNELWTTVIDAGSIYAAPKKNDFLQHDSAAFVFALPVPPQNSDPNQFWQHPNTVGAMSFHYEIIKGAWSDVSELFPELEVWTTDDPEAGTWTLFNQYITFPGENIVQIPSATEPNWPIGVRGVMFRITAGNSTTKTYDGNDGDARVEVWNVQLKNFDGNIVPSELIKRMIGGGEANVPLHDGLSTKTVYIQPSDQSELRNISYQNTTVQEVIAELGRLGDPANNLSWYSAVWEGRNLHFGPKRSDEIKWRLSRGQLSDGGLTLERSIERWWSHVQTFYLDDTDKVITSEIRSDARYRDTMPTPRRYVIDMGKVPLLETARDSFYEDFKIAQPETEIEVNGLVMNAFGVLEPLWRIRAGDTFQIDDLFPGRYVRGSDLVDPLRVFTVRETSYSVDNNTLSISPSWVPERLDILMANVQAVLG